jgi:hypothetical protein
MILLVGVKEDNVVKYFRDYLDSVEVPYKFLDLSEVGSRIVFDSSGLHFGDSEFFEYASFVGVLNRLAGLSSADRLRYPKLAVSVEWLCYLLEYEFRKVANRLSTGMVNNSKPYQLDFIGNLLLKPESHVFANTLIKKKDSVGSGYIYKSTSSIRSIVKKVVDVRKKARCPVFVQKLIQGRNIRVHVVNESCFPLQVEASAIDYRYDNNPIFTEAELPKDICNKCVKISKKHGYVFTGIDLIRTEDNKYYFLEANPSPGYSYFEGFMEKPRISEALCHYFMS